MDDPGLQHDRQLRADQPALRQQCIGVGGPGLVVDVRLRRACQEVAQLMIGGLEPPADHLDVFADRAHWREIRNITSST